eukprot:4676958-Ditylum_brightwellii.AAC.1
MSELILEGYCTNKEINVLTNKLLEHCKKEQDITTLGETISIHEWKEKVRTLNERTTLSPSGRHLGHLKALQSCSPDDPSSDEGKEL